MTRRALIAGVLVTLGAALWLGAAGGRAESPSGVVGILTRGPTQPVCTAEEPCEAPAAGVTLSFVRAGRVSGRARTGSAGGFRLRLAPGLYAIRTSAKPFGTVPTPARARVWPSRFTRLELSIDTGIR
ncbi:MAG: hypothetical protein H0V40_12165 [Actinobacteria bacterium]|nr:hypothetical protein [Actinomycetota bacterium]